MRVHQFCFNPFQENTYLLEFTNGNCAIVDPGMYDTNEREEFLRYLSENNLFPKWLLNTHAHLDHIFSNAFCAARFGLDLALHTADLPTLHSGPRSAALYGLNLDESPAPKIALNHLQVLDFDGEVLEVRHCPGHCPGHVVFIHHDAGIIIGGDVHFQGSVGRTDLPGGNAAQLDKAIREQLYTLPDNFRVYPGHGDATSIGVEKKSNYFVFEGGSRLV
jgi:glyoxylase-like metal-dependent hydrolase (beta-lactamase superfamily II)